MIASLKIIGKLDWINTEKLKEYILSCQDEETGGFADRPGNFVLNILTDTFLIMAYYFSKVIWLIHFTPYLV